MKRIFCWVCSERLQATSMRHVEKIPFCASCFTSFDVWLRTRSGRGMSDRKQIARKSPFRNLPGHADSPLEQRDQG